MAKPKPPTIVELFIPKAARFLRLPKNLTKVAVQGLFDHILEQSSARRVAQEIRMPRGSGANRFVYSFLCFRMTLPVPFLLPTDLTEVRYGFVLLIERDGYLVVFNRGAKGLDDAVEKKSRPLERTRLTHLFADTARYQKLSTRRMTIAKQELRGASYEADDLEMALVPATAARSILQNIRMATLEHGSVGVTPSTGRVRVSASKTNIEELVTFVDQMIAGISASTASAFLTAFPEPVELDELPADVLPVGLLFDLGGVYDLLHDATYSNVLISPDTLPSADQLLEALSQVLTLRDGDDGLWDVVDDSGTVFARMKRLKSSYSVRFTFPGEYAVEDAEGAAEPLTQWLRRHSAFSVTFTSPEYFYSAGKLYRMAGFEQEVAQVRRFLNAHPPLETASSEKGGPYPPTAASFSLDSIFGVVERTLSSDDKYLWCCDLGDEWADYIGVGTGRVTFYHCKHGTPTTGASDFQIVVGQALKNLSRVKFRRAEVDQKLQQAEQRAYWGSTTIPLLVRDVAGWTGLKEDLAAIIADPNATWRIALVLTALSLTQFDQAAVLAAPTPHFVQLVWLLSAFVSACRERDAQPLIYCRS